MFNIQDNMGTDMEDTLSERLNTFKKERVKKEIQRLIKSPRTPKTVEIGKDEKKPNKSLITSMFGA